MPTPLMYTADATEFAPTPAMYTVGVTSVARIRGNAPSHAPAHATSMPAVATVIIRSISSGVITYGGMK